ncbi:beta-lactamase-like protein [Protomyces lactucae-debilis]|uniref:Cleavage and polyadenylation specificity factor subunit 2 n=1 Tax=Protomyces lactucae-debilis TaxID=2754530 RepID=A0A1Y2FUX1_PROLT|nr:beta-lactamase-like protein [Protomyces lactucae-debilis]ORY87813.1 beta-lactamase-like protein [Protomyces lactucae-debilis]
MIEYTTLDEDTTASSLLSLDGTLVLLDPAAGADLHFPHTIEKPDLILLSHADLAHLGGYVYGFRHLGWHTVPCYATLPTVNLGRMAMYDALKTLGEGLTVADVNAAFDWITALRYSQATQLSGKCQGISITAYNAGHTLGGSIWRIVRGADRIVWAVDWNHARDGHLNGAALFVNGQVTEGLERPSLLITDVRNAANPALPTRVKRQTALFDSIMATLANSGSVLIPMDASTRAIELCEMLELHWRTTEPPIPFPVYFLSGSATKTIAYVKSMLEWMSDKMISTYGSSGGLFNLQYVKVVTSASGLPPGPKVVLATSSDLEGGYAQKLLHTQLAASSNNLVLLTQKSTYGKDTLAAKLLEVFESSSNDAAPGSIPAAVTLDLKTTILTRQSVPLEGEELKIYNTEQQRRREEEVARLALEERNRNIIDAEDSESEDEDERAALAAQGVLTRASQTSTAMALGSSSLLSGATFDMLLTDRANSSLPTRLKTFPFLEKRRRFDDYGEVLRPGEFKRADLDDDEGEQVAVQQASRKAGQKRKWGEVNKVGSGLAHDEDEERLAPSKLVSKEEEVHLQCRVRYIDMEGIHDGKSLRNIIESVNPRKLVLIAGSAEEKDAMREACEQMPAMTEAILVPAAGQAVEVSLDANAFEVRLSDTLAASLQWQKLSTHEVAHVTGKLLELAPEAQPGDVRVLDVLTDAADLASAPRIQSLFIGDVRLADLKRALSLRGHAAELRGGGVLLVDAEVAVEKTAKGEVVVQGHASAHFFAVRDVVYGALALIQ